MIIVAGQLHVDPVDREAFLSECEAAVRLGREAPGCLDFALSADLLEPDRINVLERWESEEQLHHFRGSGPSSDQQTRILKANVGEYRVA